MSLGSDLSAAREAAGLTLEDVAERSRVRRTVIARIEADDFSLCGGDVYARGHIKTLAKIAGIDPQPLVDEFDRLHAPEPPTAAEVFEAETHYARERRGPNWTAAMAAVVVVLLAVAGFQLLHGRSGSPSSGSRAQQSTGIGLPSASTPVTTPPATTPSPSTGSSLVAKAPSPSGVTVRLSVTGGKSWVSATANGSKVFEGLLYDGSSKLLTATHQVKLVIGNAGAVRLVVNGVDLGAPGLSGQVVRLAFGPGNPAAQG